VEEEQESLMD